MIVIDVRHEFDKLAATLDAIGKQQLPYAASLALNKTAEDVRDEVVKQMPSRFTLRRQWITKGIRIVYSNKNLLRAVVYDIDLFMNKQETGGVQVNINGKKYLAVPMPDARKSPNGSLLVKYQLKNLPPIGHTFTGPAKRNRITFTPFIFQAKDGRAYIAVREGEGSNRNGNRFSETGIKLLYELRETTKYKERFHFGDDAIAITKLNFAKRLQDEIDSAIRNARK